MWCPAFPVCGQAPGAGDFLLDTAESSGLESQLCRGLWDTDSNIFVLFLIQIDIQQNNAKKAKRLHLSLHLLVIIGQESSRGWDDWIHVLVPG